MPRCGTTSRACGRHLSSCRPPKATAPGTLGHFPCKAATLKVPKRCQRCRSDSQQQPRPTSRCGPGEGRSCPRCGSTCSRLEQALELICAPKGVRTPRARDIFPAKRQLLRVPKGVPWVPSSTPAAGRGHAARGLVAKVVPPLWQYFSRLPKRQTSASPTPKLRSSLSPSCHLPVNEHLLRRQRRGRPGRRLTLPAPQARAAPSLCPTLPVGQGVKKGGRGAMRRLWLVLLASPSAS
jgi:hypothetical protein